MSVKKSFLLLLDMAKSPHILTNWIEPSKIGEKPVLPTVLLIKAKRSSVSCNLSDLMAL